MKRRHRIALELLGPALLAAALLEVAAALGTREVASIKLFPLILVFALLLAGLPSLAFTVVMEVAFARGLDPRSWRTVLLSAGVGALSGLPVDMLMAGRPTVRPSALLFVLLGLVVGCAIGVLIRRWSRLAGRTNSPEDV